MVYLLEFNEEQNQAHYNSFFEETLTFGDELNTNDWKPLCFFDPFNRNDEKIVEEAVKIMKKEKSNKIEKGKNYLKSRIMEFSKDSVYWSAVMAEKLRLKG